MEMDMNNMMQKTLAALFTLLTLPAWAGHNSHRDYDNERYDYAKVVDAQPIFEVVRVPEQRQVCEDTVVRRRVAEHRSPAPAIFGAILGGVIGNQLSRNHGHGHHHDRAAATIAGASLGGVLGSEIQYSKYPALYYTETAPVCRVHTSWRSEQRIVAWDVTWKYHGQTYHSRMTERPGERIPVRISVESAYH
jgi:uncharacterized protein YcfJ